MEIADREILFRGGKGIAAHEITNRRRRLYFFRPGKWEIACEVLGRIRLRIAEIQGLTSVKRRSGSDLDFLWVTDFPLMQWSAEENKWNAVHHPFTRPKAEDLSL